MMPTYGNFRLQEILGTGTYGTVHKCKIAGSKNGKKFAIKLIKVKGLKQKEKQNLNRELALLKQVKHENIVELIDCFLSDDECQLCIVMDFCAGGTLKQYVDRKKGYIKEEMCLNTLRQMCEAVQFLFLKAIIHRDIKATNVLLTQDKTVKLADIGVAMLMDSPEMMMLTHHLGTPNYMSPEMVLGQPYDYKLDMWGIGICLYEMVTKKILFDVESLPELKEEMTKYKEPDTNNLPYSNDFLVLLKRLLRKDSIERPTPAEMLLWIENMHKGQFPTCSTAPAGGFVCYENDHQRYGATAARNDFQHIDDAAKRKSLENSQRQDSVQRTNTTLHTSHIPPRVPYEQYTPRSEKQEKTHSLTLSSTCTTGDDKYETSGYESDHGKMKQRNLTIGVEDEDSKEKQAIWEQERVSATEKDKRKNKNELEEDQELGKISSDREKTRANASIKSAPEMINKSPGVEGEDSEKQSMREKEGKSATGKDNQENNNELEYYQKVTSGNGNTFHDASVTSAPKMINEFPGIEEEDSVEEQTMRENERKSATEKDKKENKTELVYDREVGKLSIDPGSIFGDASVKYSPEKINKSPEMLTEENISYLLSNESDLHDYISKKPTETCITTLFEASKRSKNQGMKIILDFIVQQLTERLGDQRICVWAGEDANDQRNIVLVCCYSGVCEMSIDRFYNLRVIYREYNVTDRESAKARHSQVCQEAELKRENFDLINKAIQLHGDVLFQKHSNLEAISSCTVKSSRSMGLVRETCIVLYCRYKGMIPYGEDLYPKRLEVISKESIAVDVREGFFSLSMKTVFQQEDGKQINTPLRIGCSIGPADDDKLAGTLGPFVQINTNRIGFLTCAHVLWSWNDLMKPAGMNQEDITKKEVAQPSNDEFISKKRQNLQERICGKVVNAVFDGKWPDPTDCTSEKKYGIDAAVVEITSRAPDRGAFVWIKESQLNDSGFSESQPLMFETGKTSSCPIETGCHRTVIKVGTTTGLKRGLLTLANCMVKYSEVKLSLPNTPSCLKNKKVIMSGQMQIHPVQSPFFDLGDSGSGVFSIDDDKNLVCIGLAIGCLEDGVCVATPIDKILTALSGPDFDISLKEFRQEQMDDN